MSARGHRPRTTADRNIANVVGGISHFKFVGVSDYTASAAKDPADIVTFDESLDHYIAHGFAGMSVAEVAALRKERMEARR